MITITSEQPGHSVLVFVCSLRERTTKITLGFEDKILNLNRNSNQTQRKKDQTHAPQALAWSVAPDLYNPHCFPPNPKE